MNTGLRLLMKAALLVALILTIATTAYFYFDNPERVGVRLVETGLNATISSPFGAGFSRPPDVTPPSAPAPGIASHLPEHVAVAPLLEQLLAAAQGGDGSAACRLGFELARCKKLEELQETVNAGRARVAELPFDQATRAKLLLDIEAPLQQHSLASRLCAGVGKEMSQRAFRFLFQAAKAGDAISMVRLAFTPPPQQARTAQDSWERATYQVESSRLLMRAIEHGEPRAFWAAHMAYAGKLTADHLPGLSRDPYGAIAYGTAVRPLLVGSEAAQVDRTVKALTRIIGPERARAAAIEGMAMHAEKLARHQPLSSILDDSVSNCK